MPQKKCGANELFVFKGREARLNLAIFFALALLGPLNIKEIQKQASRQKGLSGTYYASLTKRLRRLVTDGFIKETKPRVFGKAAIYQLTNKACLAIFLHSITMQEILDQATETKRAVLLLALVNSVQEEPEPLKKEVLL